ncbi:head GIN domain-containing protein [Marinoscillum sp.]|uniref:head GIN domain-containing protein n=1 Tax=Marinoscillum sp. TaxID=2024838 RepID=UPI003BA9FF47
MKKIFLFSMAALISLSVFSQSGATRSLSSFTKVSTQEGIEAILTKGNKESARIEADGIDIEDVITDVSGGTLNLELEGDNHRNVEVTVYVTYVTLDGLKASSAGSIEVKDKVVTSGDFDIRCSSAGDIEASIEADEMDIDVSSAGDVDLTIAVNELDMEVSSAGDIEVKGTAKYVDANASSSGDIDAYDLSCDEADLRASSGASIKLTVKEKLDARASSGGSIRYEGNPRYVDADSSSGGSVRRS